MTSQPSDNLVEVVYPPACDNETCKEFSSSWHVPTRFLQAPRILTDGRSCYNESSLQSEANGNCQQNQNCAPGGLICDGNSTFQEPPGMINMNYRLDFIPSNEELDEIEKMILQEKNNDILEHLPMQSNGFHFDHTTPRISKVASVHQIAESQRRTIPDAESKAFFSVNVDGKLRKSGTCDVKYDAQKIKRAVISPRIPTPYDQNKENPFETLVCKSKHVEQQQVSTSSQIEPALPNLPVMQTLPPATISISVTQTMPEPTISGLPNLFVTPANPYIHQPQAPIAQLPNKMATRPADPQGSGTYELIPQPHAPQKDLLPYNPYTRHVQAQTVPADKIYICPTQNSMPFHQIPVQTCNQQAMVKMTPDFQLFTQAPQTDESRQHAFDVVTPKAVPCKAQLFPQTHSYPTQASPPSTRKQKAVMNSGPKSRAIAQAQDKAPDGASLREKSFTSGLHSTNFLKSYHRMKNPFVNSGFFLHRIDRIKCNTGCGLEHMIPGVFRKEAKSVQWHNPECQFFAARIPCYNCVAWNGKCRGCKMCQRDDL